MGRQRRSNGRLKKFGRRTERAGRGLQHDKHGHLLSAHIQLLDRRRGFCAVDGRERRRKTQARDAAPHKTLAAWEAGGVSAWEVIKLCAEYIWLHNVPQWIEWLKEMAPALAIIAGIAVGIVAEIIKTEPEEWGEIE